MPFYEFGVNDIFHNQIKTYPKCEFLIINSTIYYNSKPNLSGTYTNPVGHVPSGFVSLYELNIDRDAAAHDYDPDTGVGTKTLIYPFVTKEGSLTSFSTVSTTSFNSDFAYGDEIVGSYPLSASIRRYFFNGTSCTDTNCRKRIEALRNTLNHYKRHSPHYEYSSSLGNKGTSVVNLITIPSIVFGSKIKKGSLSLRYYISGTLAGELQDINKNGELIQVGPTGSVGSGSVAGVALYNEGFLVLTGSWSLDSAVTLEYKGDNNYHNPAWLYYGSGINGSDGEIYNDNGDIDALADGGGAYSAAAYTIASSSYGLSFQGTNYIPTITMLAHAPKGKLNYSNNTTYVSYGQDDKLIALTGSNFYEEYALSVKNTISSSYHDHTASFKKQTYISKIGIYDEKRNLIAIAKLATPIKKTEERDFTFKLKLDI